MRRAGLIEYVTAPLWLPALLAWAVVIFVVRWMLEVWDE
jgi:hypothetical protein